MRIKIAACVAALALFAGACSESAADLTDAELRDALQEVLTEDDSLDAATASCVIDELFESTTRDQLNRMADADSPEDLDEGDIDILTDAVFACF